MTHILTYLHDTYYTYNVLNSGSTRHNTLLDGVTGCVCVSVFVWDGRMVRMVGWLNGWYTFPLLHTANTLATAIHSFATTYVYMYIYI